MNNSEIRALVDIFREDPVTIRSMLDEKQTSCLLGAILSNVPKDTNWMHLIRMANGLGGTQSMEWFRKIFRAANNELRRRELLQALVNYGTGPENDLKLLYFEDAVNQGVFDGLIVLMSLDTVKRFDMSPIADPVVSVYFAGRIQHFIESGDPKRAFDELVISATIIEDWRPPLFEKWIERVWQAHRDKNLVTDLTKDPRDWRNNDQRKTIRFGQNRTGYITTKPKKPTINIMQEPVPLGKLWERYIRTPTEIEEALDWGTRTDPWNGAKFKKEAPNMVDAPGNMLRDMIWHWHDEAKERKLRTFCDEHKLIYPPLI